MGGQAGRWEMGEEIEERWQNENVSPQSLRRASAAAAHLVERRVEVGAPPPQRLCVVQAELVHRREAERGARLAAARRRCRREQLRHVDEAAAGEAVGGERGERRGGCCAALPSLT